MSVTWDPWNPTTFAEPYPTFGRLPIHNVYAAVKMGVIGFIRTPHASFKDNRLRFYTPEEVAPIVLRAVRNNRPFVFDHSEQRESFRELYSDVIETCFDDIEQWEQENEGSRHA